MSYEPNAIPAPASAPSDNLTILLFGPTGSGKTCLIGELAEYYYAKYKKITRLYTADKGGWITIRPYVNLGIIEVEQIQGDAFVWLDKAVQGMKYDAKKKDWVPGVDASKYAMYAYEGFTSIADELMLWMANASAQGKNIGGGGAFNFTAGTGKDAVKIGTNNMGHYSVAQQQAYQKGIQSQSLPGTILWTAGDKRGEDDVAGGVVGPQVAGKAMTGEVPRWFKYTFRLAVEVAVNAAPKHVLYTDAHMEMNAKMAKGIANARVPLAGGDGTDGVIIPPKIEPASLVKILELLEGRGKTAEDAIRKRLGM